MGNLADELDAFDRHRESRAIARNTRKHQLDALRRLAAALGNPDVSAVTADAVDGYFAGRLALGITQPTLNVDVVAFRAFWAWAIREGKTNRNPVEGRKNYKVGRQRKLFIPPDQFPHLLDVAEKRSLRDRAIVSVGLRLFLRAGDIRALTIGDVNLGPSPSVTYWAEKPNEYRTLPINPHLETDLRRWLTSYAEECGALQPGWRLFPRARRADLLAGAGPRWAPDKPIAKIEELIGDVIRAAGFTPNQRPNGRPEGVGGHVLRRSGAQAFATHLADEYGLDDAVLVTSEVLGHADMRTTMNYLDQDLRRRRAAQLLGRGDMFSSDTAGNVTRLATAG